MTLIKYKLLRASLHYHAPFKRPLLSFERIPERFFALIYDHVPKNVTVHPNELSARFGNSLAELSARYNLFGGNTSISIQADRLSFDFPSLIAADLPLVWQVIGGVHDAFPSAFPELDYERIEASSFSHLDVGDPLAVDSLLNRFRVEFVQSVFEGAAMYRPVGRIELVANDQSWSCSAGIERSALDPSAIFMSSQTSLRGQSPTASLQKKLEDARPMSESLMKAFGLENSDGADA